MRTSSPYLCDASARCRSFVGRRQSFNGYFWNNHGRRRSFDGGDCSIEGAKTSKLSRQKSFVSRKKASRRRNYCCDCLVAGRNRLAPRHFGRGCLGVVEFVFLHPRHCPSLAPCRHRTRHFRPLNRPNPPPSRGRVGKTPHMTFLSMRKTSSYQLATNVCSSRNSVGRRSRR